MRRVLFDYTQGLYRPAAAQYRRLAADGFTGARTLADWKQRVRQAWPRVSLKLLTDAVRDLPRGERLRLRVAARTERPGPGRRARRVRRAAPAARGRPDAAAAVLLRPAAARRACGMPRSRPPTEHDGDGALVFALDVEPPECGQFRTEVRIYPWHELLSHPYELGLMKWL